jgi:hypothetical protein
LPVLSSKAVVAVASLGTCAPGFIVWQKRIWPLSFSSLWAFMLLSSKTHIPLCFCDGITSEAT